ncbi:MULTISPECIES: hypothetical protein [Paraburkholderia]|uniref:Uncharacterized protein n=1 Tax=Paraburkholderia podalyriae TaxID=1938811 RepID=A0ABR7PG46_9BURK|nr:hypothetical protein [Paraburkholderia podalyriae]MBC8745342.1 hypothetical protein [Paraburkholderia podalyriae]
MFDIIFGAAHAIYIAGALVGSVILWPDQTYPLHKAPEEREMVEVVGFHPQWYKADSKCHYTGLIVPYVRDWPETVRRGQEDEVLPPDLEHTAGHAVILDKKTCPGKAEESVFLVDAVERNFGFLGGGTDFHFDDPDTIKPEYKPKWLPQVMRRIERVAEHDAHAKELLEAITVLEKNRAAKAEAVATASNAIAVDVGAAPPASASVSASEPVIPTAKTD